MTSPVWQVIRDTLVAEIGEGRFPSGTRLPTEAELSGRFGVNRHTVRRAISAMREDGLVHSRRGSGVFVTGTVVPYRLGQRTRFTQSLRDAGHSGSRRILRIETLPGSKSETKALGLVVGNEVHLTESLGLIDGVPATLGKSILPAEPLSGFTEAFRETLSITQALKLCGVADYRRAWTRISAERASGTTARHLHVTEGSPLIRTVSLNVTADDEPIEYGQTYFSADRVELIVDESAPE